MAKFQEENLSNSDGEFLSFASDPFGSKIWKDIDQKEPHQQSGDIASDGDQTKSQHYFNIEGKTNFNSNSLVSGKFDSISETTINDDQLSEYGQYMNKDNRQELGSKTCENFNAEGIENSLDNMDMLGKSAKKRHNVKENKQPKTRKPTTENLGKISNFDITPHQQEMRSVPIAIMALGSLNYITTQIPDFSLLSKTNGRQTRHLNNPSSFKASISQICHVAQSSYMTYHDSIHRINIQMFRIPYIVSKFKKLCSNDSNISNQLENIRQISQTCNGKASIAISTFSKLIEILKELDTLATEAFNYFQSEKINCNRKMEEVNQDVDYQRGKLDEASAKSGKYRLKLEKADMSIKDDITSDSTLTKLTSNNGSLRNKIMTILAVPTNINIFRNSTKQENFSKEIISFAFIALECLTFLQSKCWACLTATSMKENIDSIEHLIRTELVKSKATIKTNKEDLCDIGDNCIKIITIIRNHDQHTKFKRKEIIRDLNTLILKTKTILRGQDLSKLRKDRSDDHCSSLQTSIKHLREIEYEYYEAKKIEFELKKEFTSVNLILQRLKSTEKTHNETEIVIENALTTFRELRTEWTKFCSFIKSLSHMITQSSITFEASAKDKDPHKIQAAGIHLTSTANSIYCLTSTYLRISSKHLIPLISELSTFLVLIDQTAIERHRGKFNHNIQLSHEAMTEAIQSLKDQLEEDQHYLPK